MISLINDVACRHHISHIVNRHSIGKSTLFKCAFLIIKQKARLSTGHKFYIQDCFFTKRENEPATRSPSSALPVHFESLPEAHEGEASGKCAVGIHYLHQNRLSRRNIFASLSDDKQGRRA
jgi:hypothetical protein